MPSTGLGIALSRQRGFPIAFTSTMLLPMVFEGKKILTFLRFSLLSFNLVKVHVNLKKNSLEYFLKCFLASL